MIDHPCPVVSVKLEPCPNSDQLSIVRIDDYQCVVRTADWKDGDLGVYIPPDSIVPDTEQFRFLGDSRRIKVKKMRGSISMGLLIPAPNGAVLGEDCAERLGVVHYNPEMHSSFSTGGENISPPKIYAPKYDVENFRRYSNYFVDGEEVVATEKIHGASCRYVCHKDVIHCGSHTSWKREDPKNLWWKALSNYDVLQSWLRHNQDFVVYAEVFGQVQNLKYGARPGEIFLAVFDIMHNNRWLDYDEARKLGQPLPWVPLVYRGPFDKGKMFDLAEGSSLIPGADHYREGIVIKPVVERTGHIGRIQLKLVSNTYLEKS